jgi:diguanylate cyclase (GGDEF)-like protein/PAS domain S-box-containing protein
VAAEQSINDGFRHVLDAISDGVYVTGPDRTIRYWSAGAERITGWSADEVVGRRCDENLLGHTDLEGTRLCLSGCPLQDCLETGTEHNISEVFLRRKDGERLAVYVKTTVFEIDGERYGVEIFGELESVAGKDLAGRIQELSDSAVSDPLTGLFNRRYLDAALAQQFAMYKRLGRRYGVIQVDIDDLKSVNDRLGHLAGDEAVQFVADILSENVREMDVAARFGGDEFVVICALAAEADLITYGRRLVRIVHDSRFAPAEQVDLRVTVSAGGALVSPEDRDERAALARADAAMYTAKRSGRDDFAAAGNGSGG